VLVQHPQCTFRLRNAFLSHKQRAPEVSQTALAQLFWLSPRFLVLTRRRTRQEARATKWKSQ
jgi:hypothetical protein